YQLRHQLFQGCQFRQLFQLGQPHPRGRPPQFRHQLPQARRNSSSRDRATPLSPAATSETAPRMAASRSETPARSAANGSPLAECRVAALGIVEPSNSAIPAAPAGAIPDRIFRYLSRSDIRITIPRPGRLYSKGGEDGQTAGLHSGKSCLTIMEF